MPRDGLSIMLEERRDLGSGVGFDYEASEAVFSSIEQPELPRQDNAYDEGDAAYLTGIRLLLVVIAVTMGMQC